MVFPLILCVLSELIYNFGMALYRFLSLGRLDPAYTLINVILPEIFFSLIVTLFVYRFFLNTNRRMDDIDKLRGKNAA